MAPIDVSARGAPKNAVEPAEESRQRTVVHLLSWLQEQRGERGTEREGVEGGENHRDGNRQRKLLVEPPRDAGNEYRRNKHRRKNQRDGDHRPGDFLHRFNRRVPGREALLDVAFNGLDDDDGVIHHQSNGEHQAEKGEGVDGKPKYREQRKGSHQRNRHGQQRDERRPPALQENIYDDHHQQQGLP